jgi:hypothetical protein
MGLPVITVLLSLSKIREVLDLARNFGRLIRGQLTYSVRRSEIIRPVSFHWCTRSITMHLNVIACTSLVECTLETFVLLLGIFGCIDLQLAPYVAGRLVSAVLAAETAMQDKLVENCTTV